MTILSEHASHPFGFQGYYRTAVEGIAERAGCLRNRIGRLAWLRFYCTASVH